MRSIFFTLALFLLPVFTIYSQTPTPTPVADDDIVKITTALIQVDVSVTDGSGKVITDLKPEDFEIYENGKKQNISNFSFISNENTEAVKPQSDLKLDGKIIPAPPVANKLKPEQVRRTVALVVDDLTLSFESVNFVRRALRKFVNEQMQEGDLVAIIRTGGGIGALQQFTYNKQQLLAAADKLRWNPLGSGGISAFAPIEPTPLEVAKANGADVSDEDLEAEKNSIQASNDFREDIFATGTLGAINYIIRGMRELPGRKSIMLLSDGFSLFSATTSGFKESSRVLESLKQLVDLANRSSVVVYSIDARGLQTTGITAADNTSSLSSEALQERISDRRDELFNTQDGLNYLSKETGGFAVFNNNDINKGIEKVLDDQSYYLIGYEPDSETFDPEKRRFNKLEVKVRRKGVKVRYRSGFFGISDEKIKTPIATTAEQQILTAITSPFAINDINLSLNSIFKGYENNSLSVSSFLHIDSKDLTFQDAENGAKKVVFDVLAMSFGDNGIAIGEIGKTYTVTVKPQSLEKIKKNGLTYFFTFPIKKAGAYQMRVAIRDHISEKVGSASQFIEVPKLTKNRLTLSGIVLTNLTYNEWKETEEKGTLSDQADPFLDTSLRQFNRGTVLTYGFEIYNAKSKKEEKPQLEVQTRLFYNGKNLFVGQKTPVSVSQQANTEIINSLGALSLGTEMQLGDYVLQIIVTDKLAKKNRQIATQFVQFEIIE